MDVSWLKINRREWDVTVSLALSLSLNLLTPVGIMCDEFANSPHRLRGNGLMLPPFPAVWEQLGTTAHHSLYWKQPRGGDGAPHNPSICTEET